LASAEALQTLADKHRQQHRTVDDYQTIRHWQADAGTYCYQTHIAISGQPREQLAVLAETLYNASTMGSQPWYPQFLGGDSQAIAQDPPPGISTQQLALGQFDLGLPATRCYRQLVSLAWPQPDSAVIVARSVDTGPTLPQGAPLAFTLAPNGEVLHWAGDCLHWHHICCTPGAALLPGAADRWLINALRWLRLDGAERKTYRDEAVNMQLWLQG
jgi:hypothetical protein